jgi:hypothetical protein
LVLAVQAVCYRQILQSALLVLMVVILFLEMLLLLVVAAVQVTGLVLLPPVVPAVQVAVLQTGQVLLQVLLGKVLTVERLIRQVTLRTRVAAVAALAL